MTTTPDEVRFDDAATGSLSTSRANPMRALPWAFALLAIAVAAVLGFRLANVSDEASDRDDVARATGRAITVLTNWEADDLGNLRQEVRTFGTDRFQDEAQQYFDEFSKDLADAGASSTGEVLDLVADVTTEDTAVALGVVRQQITLGGDQAVDVACWGARAHLLRQDGVWLLDHLELYGSNSCPEDVADPEAPGGRG